jgi:hypothetical protein
MARRKVAADSVHSTLNQDETIESCGPAQSPTADLVPFETDVTGDVLIVGTEQEISANIEHQENATKDLFFLVSILQVGAKVVSFSVSFPKSTLHALIAFLVSIPRCASMDDRPRPRPAAPIELHQCPLATVLCKHKQLIYNVTSLVYH